MADLQDTNAATEEIYGPLLIVDCPVTDEMISQNAGGAVAEPSQLQYCAVNILAAKCVKEYRNNVCRCKNKEKTRQRSDLNC